MAYLKRVIERNPQLLQAALELHQSGRIPPNTWVVDLDAVSENARCLAAAAKRLGLSTYLMSKQHNRNPYINLLARAHGLGKVVAVDAQCLLLCRRFGVEVGHAGHLNQIPRHLIPALMAMRPEVVTIYSREHAAWINEAARAQGRIQGLLLRITNPDDVTFEGQEGGFTEEEAPHAAAFLSELNHVRLAGVTSFPCVVYPERAGELVTLTSNMTTLVRTAERLRELGHPIEQINAPGNTASHTMPFLKAAGATHVEPGNGLLGTTPDHALRAGLPEKTALVFVSEVTHHVGGKAYALGGCGRFNDTYEAEAEGLVGSDWATARENAVPYLRDVPQCIDYHMILDPGPAKRCRIGDSVLFAFRTQMQMTRSYVAAVSGLSGTSEPKLHALFDPACHALDAAFEPMDPGKVRQDIDAWLRMVGV